ncbi:Hypothetical_protein [Hexamita inflata]|uniref:Hypothetical_protein n=1 Tax=Hexamita inflata TaxID=28002 RepID=A0ABP1IK56_9EUKA
MHVDTVTSIPQYSQQCIQTLPILHMIFVIPVTISKRSSIETYFKVELPSGGASSQYDPEQAEKSVINKIIVKQSIIELQRELDRRMMVVCADQSNYFTTSDRAIPRNQHLCSWTRHSQYNCTCSRLEFHNCGNGRFQKKMNLIVLTIIF